MATFMGSVLAHVGLEASEDGSAEAVVAVGDVEEFVNWTLGYGTHALILEPAEAAKRARAVLAEVVRKHA
jgi:predicted DNA-binding transcriptional regulator YafY